MEQARISSQHGTHESRSARAAGKSTAQQDTPMQGADASAFSFLLASLGAGGQAQDVVDTPLLSSEVQDPAALAALQSGLPLGLQPGLDGMSGPVGLPGQGGLGSVGSVGFGAERANLESLVGQTAMLDGAAEAAAVNGTAPATTAAQWRAGLSGRFQSTLAAAGAEGGTGLGNALNSALRGVGKDEKKGVATDLGAGSATGAAALAAPLLEQRDMSLSGAMLGVRGNGLDPSMAVSSPEMAGATEWAASGDARSSRQSSDSAESGASQLGHFGVGEAGQELSGTDAAFSLEAATADATQAAIEDQLAEQVAFWVNQKTQNAEITLDRDGQPVEVTVSLTGNEAHVTFRSDQEHTRDMLDASVAQLRDLLQSEGLQLSGVTVGTSGEQGSRDGGGPHEDGRRQGARQATVHAAAPAGNGGRSMQVTDRSVDVFV